MRYAVTSRTALEKLAGQLYEERMPRYRGWTTQYIGIAPVLDSGQRAILTRHDILPQDLIDLTTGLN